jgi:hypothetical protein
MRYTVISTIALLLPLACAAAPKAPTPAAAKATVHATAAGVSYVVAPDGFTDAMRAGGELEVSFSCYNRGRDAIDGPTIYAESRILVATAGGKLVEPVTQPLGIWDGPSVIPAGGSFTSTVALGVLFPVLAPGDYVVRWEVDGGLATLPVKVLAEADYYLYRLQNDAAYNDWGMHVYGEDGTLGAGLAREAVALGQPLVPGLAHLTNDQREAPIVGSEDATIGAMYGWRVCDIAGILLNEIWGQQAGALRSRDPAERDKRLEELQLYYRIHAQELKE